jgi:hypothetical protein
VALTEANKEELRREAGDAATATLNLCTVTLCAVTSVNIEATIAALKACLDKADFAECLLLTHAGVRTNDPRIRVVPIDRLASARDYSHFILKGLAEHIHSSHCLVVQWDGFLLNPDSWVPEFLSFDYVGAPWPHFPDNHDVGNGGFSLRSRKLLEACRDASFTVSHPEDMAICRVNRPLLEAQFGIRFADRDTAQRFAFERSAPTRPTFGFHGIFNMIAAVGPERFWELYTSLDDASTAFVDYRTLMRQLSEGRNIWPRRISLTWHWLRHHVDRMVA